MVRLPRWLRPAPPRELPPVPPQASPPHPAFDAVVTIGPHNLPFGVPPGQGIAAVKQAVEAVDGAAWVSVEHHPLGAAASAVKVFAAGSHNPGSTAARLLVEAAVAAAMRALAAVGAAVPAIPATGFGVSGLRATGFAEGQARYLPTLPENTAASTPDTAVAGLAPSGKLRALADTDLLAHLLGHVVPTGAADAARRAVSKFGSFAAVLSAPDGELGKQPGLGLHSVAAIKLLHAAALRLSRAAVMDQPVLDGSDALIAYLTAVLARESIEHFRILFLDAEGRLRADEAQARGTVNHTPVYPREVVRRALELGAASVILVHNHPSGDPSPSLADIEMTALIEDAAEVLGLGVRDHIIVGNGRWLSFRKEGLLRTSPAPQPEAAPEPSPSPTRRRPGRAGAA